MVSECEWYYANIPSTEISQSRILVLITVMKQVTPSYKQGWRTVMWARHSQYSGNSHRAEALQRCPAAVQVRPFEKPSPIQESMGIHLSSASFIPLWEADVGKCAEVSRGRMSE